MSAGWAPGVGTGYAEPVRVVSPNGACPFDINGAHDFDAHTSYDVVNQLHCRKCGLIVPSSDASTELHFVHTYKGEGLTTCGLEVVGPCPDCATAAT